MSFSACFFFLVGLCLRFAMRVCASGLQRYAEKRGLFTALNTQAVKKQEVPSPRAQQHTASANTQLLPPPPLHGRTEAPAKHPHAYQGIMHPSPPVPVLLNGAHTQQAFHPSTTYSLLPFFPILLCPQCPPPPDPLSSQPADCFPLPVQHA